MEFRNRGVGPDMLFRNILCRPGDMGPNDTTKITKIIRAWRMILFVGRWAAKIIRTCQSGLRRAKNTLDAKIFWAPRAGKAAIAPVLDWIIIIGERGRWAAPEAHAAASVAGAAAQNARRAARAEDHSLHSL